MTGCRVHPDAAHGKPLPAPMKGRAGKCADGFRAEATGWCKSCLPWLRHIIDGHGADGGIEAMGVKREGRVGVEVVHLAYGIREDSGEEQGKGRGS